MFALVSTSSEGPAKLQTLKRCDLERVVNALEELPERKDERESCARTFSELANALEANMRKKMQDKYTRNTSENTREASACKDTRGQKKEEKKWGVD